MTQHYHISFTMSKTPEGLERVLRIIRQRGFRIINMNVSPAGVCEYDTATCGSYQIKIELYGLIREISFLLPQLEKVYQLTNLNLEEKEYATA